MQLTNDACSSVLKIAGNLHISTANELRDALRDWVSRQAEPLVDLSEVEECDAASLQLLCSASKTAEQSNKHFGLAGVSVAIQNAGAALALLLPGKQPAKRGQQGGI